jgi:hypothetical protein
MKKTAHPKALKTSTKVKSKNLNPVHKIGIGAIVILISTLMIISFIINSSVHKNCLKAQNKYGGTCLSALITVVKDKDNSFREKNTAIWTLGRLRQKEAIATLKSLYTGIIPSREPYDNGISQYEIKKALWLIDRNTNLSPVIEKTLKEKLAECLPKSDMESKKNCDLLLKTIKNYTDCSNAGFPIQESYPEKCRTVDGRTFINSK